ELLEVVGNAADLTEACNRLVAIANEHGGEDNITAVVIRIEPCPPTADVPLRDAATEPAEAFKPVTPKKTEK
ncbi:MAG TPA: hypothetical protein PKA88_27225, partial [Polyangiaceae bacterium]|nr:hypothetical protein [Polyangiaceae bacterium]